MKTLALPVFTSEAMSSANSSVTSGQFDLGELTRLWLHCTPSATTADNTVLLKLSNDPISKKAEDSDWISEGSATNVLASGFVKYSGLGAQKCKVVLARSSGAVSMTVRGIAKES